MHSDLASGISIDWVYDALNVPLSYCFEFRDKGNQVNFILFINKNVWMSNYPTFKGNAGFILPANQIIPNALEVIDGMVVMVKEAKALEYL